MSVLGWIDDLVLDWITRVDDHLVLERWRRDHGAPRRRGPLRYMRVDDEDRDQTDTES